MTRTNVDSEVGATVGRDVGTSARDDPPHFAIGGVILAAGHARRMGRPKTTLLLEGRALLDHVIDSALSSRVSEWIVVLRPGDDDARRIVEARKEPRLRVVVTSETSGGQGRSLAVGLAALDPRVDAAAILLADQPGVDPALIDRIAEVASRSDRPAVRPVHVRAHDRVPGHPVVVTRRLFDAARALEGDVGARALWRDSPDRLEEVEVESSPPVDVDTAEEYDALIRETSGSRD